MATNILLNDLCQKLLSGEIRQSDFHQIYAETFLNLSLSKLPRGEPNSPIQFVELEDGYRMEINKLGSVIGQKKIRIPVDKYIYYKSDGHEYELIFPFELKPRDYLTRILEILKEGLQFFCNSIKLSIDIYQSEYYREDLQNNCAYYWLKILRNNFEMWYPNSNFTFQKFYGEMVSYNTSKTIELIQYLMDVRCSIAHQDESTNCIEKTYSATVAGNSLSNVLDLFEILRIIMRNDSLLFAIKNITNLSKLFFNHLSWLKVRKSFIRSRNEGPVAGVLPSVETLYVDRVKERNMTLARMRFELLYRNKKRLENKFKITSEKKDHYCSLVELFRIFGLHNTTEQLKIKICSFRNYEQSKVAFYYSCFILYHFSSSNERTSDQDYVDYLLEKDGCISDDFFNHHYHIKSL